MGPDMKKCSLCRDTYKKTYFYCSEGCQKEDWPKHRLLHKLYKAIKLADAGSGVEENEQAVGIMTGLADAALKDLWLDTAGALEALVSLTTSARSAGVQKQATLCVKSLVQAGETMKQALVLAGGDGLLEDMSAGPGSGLEGGGGGRVRREEGPGRGPARLMKQQDRPVSHASCAGVVARPGDRRIGDVGDVAWGDYARGMHKTHRVVRDKRDAQALCAISSCVFGGLKDGTLVVWDRETLEEMHVLKGESKVGCIWCLAVYGNRIVSGHHDGCLCVWNTQTLVREQVLQGHTEGVHSLAVWEHHLVSASKDKSIKVWQMGETLPWPLLGTIQVHHQQVMGILAWQGRVISVSIDKKVCVCDIATRQHLITLDEHCNWILALAIHGDKLFTVSVEGMIIMWALGTWKKLSSIQVRDLGHAPSNSTPQCMIVHGSKLLYGGSNNGHESGFIVVLDAATLTYESAVPLHHAVNRMMGLRGEVWGRLKSCDIVVWGKPDELAGAGRRWRQGMLNEPSIL